MRIFHSVKTFTVLIAFLFLIIPEVSFAEQDAGSAIAATQTANFDSIIGPTSPIDIIKNLKAAIEHEYFFDNRFYDEENLKTFFGTNGARWLTPKGNTDRIGVDLIKYKEEVSVPVYLQGQRLDGLSIRLTKRKSEQQQLKIYLSMNVMRSDPRLHFSRIEEIFGPNWKEINHPPQPTRIRKMPTDIHGNDLVEYALETANSLGTVTIDYTEQASVGYLVLNLKGKNND